MPQAAAPPQPRVVCKRSELSAGGTASMPVREKGRRSLVRRLHVPSHVPSHPQTAAKVRGFSSIASRFAAEADWLLEQRGFELLVPRVAEERWRTDKLRSRVMAVVGAGPPMSAPFTVGLVVRIPFAPAESQPRTMDARGDQHLDACTPGGQLALPRSIRLMSATVWHALRRDRDHRAVVGAGYRD